MKSLFRYTRIALATFALGTCLTVQAQTSRDQINIVGSSTVYPFATVVAETFGNNTKFKTPTIESTGSGGGLKAFCAGVGVQYPDITNSSRRIKASEIDLCARNGIDEIIEVKIGYDGIVIANSRNSQLMKLTRKEIFLALAKQIPNPDGSETLIDNPYKNWSDIRSELPGSKIEVLGPPPTSGTRDAFVELAMEGGCKAFGWINDIKKKDKNQFKAVCHTIREDGSFIEAGENDNLIVNKLNANPDALGIFGFSFLDQNQDSVQGSYVDGHAPTFDEIADGNYPVSRPLYFYAKKAHIGNIPGLREYLNEFISDNAIGEDGYLTDKGLIPLPEGEKAAVVANVEGLLALKLAVN